MKKRIKGLQGPIVVESAIVLTESELNKLENPANTARVDAYAKDMDFNWHVETCDNTSMCIISVTTREADDDYMHQLEIKHANFMKFLGELPIKEEEPEEEEEGDVDEIEHDIDNVTFVKTLLSRGLDLPETHGRHVVGAMVIDTTTHPMLAQATCWGHISYDLLKEMCHAYLEKYDHKLESTESTAS